MFNVIFLKMKFISKLVKKFGKEKQLVKKNSFKDCYYYQRCAVKFLKIHPLDITKSDEPITETNCSIFNHRYIRHRFNLYSLLYFSTLQIRIFMKINVLCHVIFPSSSQTSIVKYGRTYL
jgi:hypothetical protein